MIINIFNVQCAGLPFHFLLFTLSLTDVSAQLFSEDKDEFRSQVISRLRSIGTESAIKIAYDFQNAWDGKFTTPQQDKVHTIALRMQRKGYRFYPYFYHYFTYLAYSVAQENLNRDELSTLLDINEQVLETLPRKEYADFVFGLNIYFARRYLSLEKTLHVQAPGGTYSFKLLDEVIPIQEDVVQEEIYEEDTSGFISDEELAALNETQDNQNTDDWGVQSDPWADQSDPWADQSDPWADQSDPWADQSDPWADQSDPWADQSDPWADQSDPWSNSGDSWGDSGDSWGDDGWGEQESTPAAPPTASKA